MHFTNPRPFAFPSPWFQQIWYYDIVLTYNYQPSFTFRLYSTLETSFAVSTPPPHSVDERGWWSMQALSTCNGACVFRLACTQNVYLDSTYPSPFYSGTTVGGNFDISTAVLDKYVNVYPMQSTPKVRETNRGWGLVGW